MLSKLNELGMMTSEYVYILPAIEIDLSPWVDAGTSELVPGYRPYFANVKMVSFHSFYTLTCTCTFCSCIDHVPPPPKKNVDVK